MTQAVKILNLVSTFFFVAILLLVYAYLPVSVDLNVSEWGNVHRQHFFYYALTSFLVVNILSRVLLSLSLQLTGEDLQAWMMTLIFVLNLYLTFLVGFVGVWNNSTHISPSSYLYLNYLGPVFIVVWLVGLIFLMVKNVGTP